MVYYIGSDFIKHHSRELSEEWDLHRPKEALDPTAKQGRSRSETAVVSAATRVDSSPRAGLVIFDDPTVSWNHYFYVFKRYMVKVLGVERVSVLYLLDINTSPTHDADLNVFQTPGMEDGTRIFTTPVHLQQEDLPVEEGKATRYIGEVRNWGSVLCVDWT